jgi:hypothetical protein
MEKAKGRAASASVLLKEKQGENSSFKKSFESLLIHL